MLLLFLHVRLRNGVVVDPGLWGGDVAREPSWYYLKCGKQCAALAFGDAEVIPIESDLYVAFLNESQAVWALQNSAKLKLVSAKEKRFREEFSNSTGQFLLFTAERCDVPFEFRRLSRNILLVETSIEAEVFVREVERIPCVRGIDEYKGIRLDMSMQEYRESMSKLGWVNGVRDRAFVNYGLDGMGQTASIIDTGVDFDSCWFADPQQSVVFNKPMDHRKIKAYFTDGSGRDVASGHGSFVAGIIAGRAICNIFTDEVCPGTFYDGLAPNADLIVHDYYSNDAISLLNWTLHASATSQRLEATVQYHGFDFQASSLLTYMFDGIAYANPEMLFVFPAGDKTEETESGNVPSPGDSKNVLTVGAINGETDLNELDSATPVVVVNCGVEHIGYCDPNLGVNFHSYVTDNPEMLKDTYVIGTDVLILVPATFDLSVVHDRYKIVLLFNDNVYRSRIDRPVIRMPVEARGNFNDGDKIFIRPFKDLRSEYIASSKSDIRRYGVVKPEILLPGGPFFGPNAGQTECGKKGVRLGEGSSVSAALAVGYSLLIRQFIGGTNGPLLRAIFSHFSEKKIPVLDQLFLSQKKGISFINGTVQDGYVDTYRLEANRAGSVNVTIAWNDPPHDPLAPSRVLFNIRLSLALDNVVVRQDHDPFNSVKTVTVQVQPGSTVDIRVEARQLVRCNNANYSLVVTGPFLQAEDVKFRGTTIIPDNTNEKPVIVVDDGQEVIATATVGVLQYFKYQFSKWRPGNILSISVVPRPNASLLTMFSIGELPTFHSAHCTSDNCPWATVDGNSFTLGYSLWDFVEDDALYLGVYSKTNTSLSVSIGHKHI